MYLRQLNKNRTWNKREKFKVDRFKQENLGIEGRVKASGYLQGKNCHVLHQMRVRKKVQSFCLFFAFYSVPVAQDSSVRGRLFYANWRMKKKWGPLLCYFILWAESVPNLLKETTENVFLIPFLVFNQCPRTSIFPPSIFLFFWFVTNSKVSRCSSQKNLLLHSSTKPR